LSRLVDLAHLRWPVEQFYEDAKGECGFDHFQGRSWAGLHRHLALVMLAYTFLMLQSLGQEVQVNPAPEAAFPPLRGSSASRLAIARYSSCFSRMSSYGSLKPNKSKLFVLGETNKVVLTT
jgi:Transposase DDE domain